MTSRDVYTRTPLVVSVLFQNKNGLDDTIKYLLEHIRVPLPDINNEEYLFKLTQELYNKDIAQYQKLIDIFENEKVRRNNELKIYNLIVKNC